MKYAESVRLNVFCKVGEDRQKIESALRSFIPFDMAQEKVQVDDETAEGFNERIIHILSITLRKERHTNQFFKALFARLTQKQKEQLREQIPSRVDDECKFFMRFDKDALINMNELWLTDAGNCFHISAAIAAFPHRREVAISVVERLLAETIK